MSMSINGEEVVAAEACGNMTRVELISGKIEYVDEEWSVIKSGWLS